MLDLNIINQVPALLPLVLKNDLDFV